MLLAIVSLVCFVLLFDFYPGAFFWFVVVFLGWLLSNDDDQGVA